MNSPKIVRNILRKTSRKGLKFEPYSVKPTKSTKQAKSKRSIELIKLHKLFILAKST